MENFLYVPDHTLKIAGKYDLRVTVREDLTQRFAITQQLFVLGFDLLNDVTRLGQLFDDFFVEHASDVALVAWIEAVTLLKHLVRQLDRGQILELYRFTAQPVLAVTQLNQLTH